ncbi:MAG: hypothetical protein IPM36_17085 [Lewinellaceae bacterium]|nr:hypothetical protein [Lewinellaceae bacterium]
MEQAYQIGEDAIPMLLQILDYSWADEEDESRPYSKSSSAGLRNTTDESESQVKYDTLSAEDFNRIDQDWEAKSAGHLNHGNVQIAEFLAALGRGLITPDISTDSDSLELTPPDPDTDAGGEKAVGVDHRPPEAGAVIDHAIHRYLLKLTGSYENHLCDFFANNNLMDFPTQKNIKQLSNLRIHLAI